MQEIKATVLEQLQQLQMLMHRASFHHPMGGPMGSPVPMRNPHRGRGAYWRS